MSSLLPDVLQRTSPQYAKAVRSFSKRAEAWLVEVALPACPEPPLLLTSMQALVDLPEVYVTAKRAEASLFSQVSPLDTWGLGLALDTAPRP